MARQRLRLSSPTGPGKPRARHQEASRRGGGRGGGCGGEVVVVVGVAAAVVDRATSSSSPSSFPAAPAAAAAPLGAALSIYESSESLCGPTERKGKVVECLGFPALLPMTTGRKGVWKESDSSTWKEERKMLSPLSFLNLQPLLSLSLALARPLFLSIVHESILFIKRKEKGKIGILHTQRKEDFFQKRRKAK